MGLAASRWERTAKTAPLTADAPRKRSVLQAHASPKGDHIVVSITSDGAPVMNALVESQSSSCITDASGACGLYAKSMDVLKVTNQDTLSRPACCRRCHDKHSQGRSQITSHPRLPARRRMALLTLQAL